MSRLVLLAVTVVLALAGCAATPAGAETVELEGRIVAIAGSGSDRGWIIQVDGEGMLPLQIDGTPPVMATGVVIEVPADLPLPDDPHDRIVALAEYSAEHETAFRVTTFL